ncbi:chaperone protein dnaj gfa2 [Quercus suber]|uniref:Chaperone protein dnaj gfa2 n=1 Tax=Quercus suber TaxID=58331 RepID=A0AAW0L7K6_QUESU
MMRSDNNMIRLAMRHMYNKEMVVFPMIFIIHLKISSETILGGEDVKVSLELSFMEAVQGSTKNVTFQTHLPCEPCGGRGVAPGVKPEKCTRCKGLGTPKYICKSCKGRRVVLGTNYFILALVLDSPPLPFAGVDNDETIKVSRSGGADPDGNQPGDLYIVIKVREDPVFRREGADIHVDAVLSITQMNSWKSPIMLFLNTSSVTCSQLMEEGFKEFVPRQRELIEEFAKEEQGEFEKRATAGASGKDPNSPSASGLRML